jgi:hypothetical protein
VKTVAALLLLAAFSAAVVSGQTQSADGDWDWLSESRPGVLERLMPVENQQGFVTFRSSNGAHLDIIEKYFRIDRSLDGTSRAVVIRPEGEALHRQLLEQHLRDRSASAETVAGGLRFSTFELTQSDCPQVTRLIKDLSTVKATPPTDDIFLDATVHRIVIDAASGRLDVSLYDERNALVQWALRTSAALDRCIRSQRR